MISESLHILIPHTGNILLYTTKGISSFVIKLYIFILEGDDYVIIGSSTLKRKKGAQSSMSKIQFIFASSGDRGRGMSPEMYPLQPEKGKKKTHLTSDYRTLM